MRNTKKEEEQEKHLHHEVGLINVANALQILLRLCFIHNLLQHTLYVPRGCALLMFFF